ncbi:MULTISPECIES: winged helix-turn-helix transcriptional regulator [unclassified Brevundimonas]|uniref:winged helix-turn-helix transcriptional regulator n=1 Tax=unclassified Brevundimonas TaxID=2622653 RepID=UPI0025B81E1C|nr:MULTISPECIES: helix-turn-helix domain-containing protein [unclassified Brevundimonas]
MSATLPDTTADKSRYLPANSAGRALNVLGDRWVLMILGQAITGVSRFEEFQSRIGIARSLLTERLRRLETAGVLARHRYNARPPRDEYRLTEMGQDLFRAAMMIIRWERNWYPDAKVRVLNLTHTDGHVLVPQCRCAHCDEEVIARETHSIPGPGAGLEPPLKARAQRRSVVDNPNTAHTMIERTIDVLGDRWIAHTIAASFLGCRRFGEFQQRLGIATNILSERLARLVTLGILEQRPYQTQPVRMEYRLTPKGLDLFPLVVELVNWGARWLSGPEGPPEILMHKCGQKLVTRIVCGNCNQDIERGSLTGL